MADRGGGEATFSWRSDRGRRSTGCHSRGGKHTTKIAAADGDSHGLLGWSVAVAADGTAALVGACRNERLVPSSSVVSSREAH